MQQDCEFFDAQASKDILDLKVYPKHILGKVEIDSRTDSSPELMATAREIGCAA